MDMTMSCALPQHRIAQRHLLTEGLVRMRSSVRAFSFVLAAASLSLLGCKMSPEKACAKAEELFAKPGDTAKTQKERAKCVADFTKMQQEDPKAYACTTQCLKSGSKEETVLGCMRYCDKSSKTASKSTGGGDDSTPPAPVDSLTPSSVKSKIESEYRGFGEEIQGEKSNSVGWSADVMIGKKEGPGDMHVYKVMLLDVKSETDGYAVIEGLKKSGVADASRVGNKKAVYVQCQYQRDSTTGRKTKPCGSYDGRIHSFLDDIAPSR